MPGANRLIQDSNNKSIVDVNSTKDRVINRDKDRVPRGDIRELNPNRKPNSVFLDGQGPVANSNYIRYSLKDYKWTNDFFKQNSNAPVPMINIREFQPDFILNWGDVVDDFASVLDLFGLNALSQGSEINQSRTAGLIERAQKVSGPLVGGIKTAVRNAAANHINKLMDEISTNRSKAFEQLLDIPISFVKGMFSGDYIADYEIPYDGDVYLTANGSSKWDRNGLSEGIGNRFGEILKNNLYLNVPVTPTWTNEDGGGEPPEIETTFFLYNDTMQALKKNYKFLNSLISGAYWTQLGYTQKSPNLYDVVIPGRLHYYYCTMDMVVEFSGKIRALNDAAYKDFNSAFGAAKIDPNIMVPDAYKITCKFTSLMPNSFNTYLDYIINGSDSSVKSVSRFDLSDLVAGIGNEFGSLLSNTFGFDFQNSLRTVSQRVGRINQPNLTTAESGIINSLGGGTR